jgi:hypothetical protein
MNCKTLCLVSYPVLWLGLALPVAQALPGPDPATRAGVGEAYGKLPLSFEVNQGQTDDRYSYYT